ncbi:unnamed protein product [Onchocerca flexuosa]|uniref:Translocon-associated protein subunit alpha n=1 Tax=Onchocerca flexuosa TaxID=387005 RepID=A0A183I0K1_9BILA|nr:unnamed protein product [Onchocerca flexuosa]
MGLQWFLLLLFCFLYDWLFANGSDSLKEINGTKLPDPMIQKNQMAQAAVTWITADTKNNTNKMTILTSSMPLQVQHASSPTALAGIVQVVSVKTAQTSTRQVVLTSTNRQQEHLGLQTSSGFADISSPVQAFTEIGDFDEPEDTHFLYYIVVFGTVIVCLYVASHNKKKILGFIIEGRRPSSSTRRAAHRYRRLSQHDDNGFDPMNVTYSYHLSKFS